MVLFFLRRLTVMLLIIAVICTGIIALSDIIPDRIGLLMSTVIDDDWQTELIYYDADTGITAYQAYDVSSQRRFPYPEDVDIIEIAFTDDDPMLAYYLHEVDNGTVTLARFDGVATETLQTYTDLNPLHMLWLTDRTLLGLVHTVDGDSVLSQVDLETGNLTTLMTLPDIRFHDFRYVPDSHFMLVRDGEPQSGRTHTTPEKTMLVDMQTYQIVRDFGIINFAYPSPDSQKIAIGYPVDGSYLVDILIYDVEDDTLTPINRQVSRVDVQGLDHTQGTGVSWHPDSAALAILDQGQEQLIYHSLAGDSIIIDDSNLRPHNWSPDGDILLTTGYLGDNPTGIYVVQFATAVVRPLETVSSFASWNTRLLWSTNGQHFAYIKRTLGTENSDTIAIFDRQGRTVRSEKLLTVRDGFRSSGSVMWVDAILE